MRMKRPTVVDATSFICYLPVGLLAISKVLPFVVTYHEVWIGRWISLKGLVTGLLGEIWERLTIRLPWHRFIAVSKSTAESLQKNGVPPNRIVIIPIGVNQKNLVKERKLKGEGNAISCVARLVAGKRIDVLIDAIALAKQRNTFFYAKIVGTGPERERLQYQAGNLGIADQISFMGRLARDSDVHDIVRSSMAFCLPSEVEGFGIVLLEAMSMGVPYIAADIPATREITDGGRGGILVRPGSAIDTYKALVELASSSDFRKRLGREGIEVSRKYDWDVISSRLLELYAEVSKKNRAEDN